MYEPKLRAIIRRNIRAGRLRYTTNYDGALLGAEFAYIAIDTPIDADDQSDLSGIYDAVRRVAGAIPGGRLCLIITAQVPVGTCARLAAIAAERNPGAQFDAVYVPEFLQLGRAVETFRSADRFVVGAGDQAVAERVAALYRPLGRPLVITDVQTAEMAKHASNAFLAVSISFINEMANVCDAVGADVSQVAKIMKLDRRIGPHAFLSAGLGFAGGTLGRELRALQRLGSQNGCEVRLVDAAMDINRSRIQLVGNCLRRMYGELEGLQVSVLGLTYKPGTSTLRRSVALEIIRDLLRRGCTIKAFDPLARLDDGVPLPPFEACQDPYTAVEGSDASVLVTEWAGIKEMDMTRLCVSMRRPLFIDTRNVFDSAEMQRVGFTYWGIGRGAPRDFAADSLSGAQ